MQFTERFPYLRKYDSKVLTPDSSGGKIHQKRGDDKVDTKQKINELLNKINSEKLLKRIYEFIKYIYIYQQ